MTDIKITTEYITLDSFLKFCGEAETGGEAKLLILNGDVLLNGEICTQRKKKLFENDIVEIENVRYRIVR